MKKQTIISVLIFMISFNSFSQRATLENDTAKYNGHDYYVGKVVNLLYGSVNDKSFGFVYVGSGMGGGSKMQSNWSKYPVRIDKVYKTSGTVYFRGIALNEKGNNAIPMNKVFVDITGAVDNKEIKED
jgi:hypothetical protein